MPSCLSLSPRSAIEALFREEGGGRTYHIRDLAIEFGLTLRALRFYEMKGLLKPTRRNSLTRVYSSRDRQRLRIALLWLQLGFTIAEAKQFIEADEALDTEDDRLAATVAILNRQLPVLLQQQREIGEAVKTVGSMLEGLHHRDAEHSIIPIAAYQ